MRRSRFASLATAAAVAAACLFGARDGAAQYPPPAQPYPPPQPYPPQPYPPPAQPYPPPAQPYPPPAQPYPGQPYPGQPYPPPYQVPLTRSPGEMTALYVMGGVYGVGTGVWIDALGKVKDPGVAVIAPIVLGAAVPIGAYFWDSQAGPLPRGVPASIATGIGLGAVEGLAIDATQWQYTHEHDGDWSFATQTTLVFVTATGGGIGGWAFGEWLKPDPRSMTFIASGSAWGAISGSFIGIAVSGKDWKDGASVAGLIGYNVGLAGSGAVSVGHTLAWAAQRNMWAGYGIGAGLGCLVFPFYLFGNADAKHGFIGPGLGGLAGMAIAGAISWNYTDPGDPGHVGARDKTFKPPFNVGIGPAPLIDASELGLGSGPISNVPTGTLLTGSGTF